MAFVVELYWALGSPYSYLAVKQLAGLRRRWAFDITPRVVLPTALRDPGLHARMTGPWRAYAQTDAARIAAMLGLPCTPPHPDLVPITEHGAPAPDQSAAWRLSRLAAAASEMGRGLPFIDELGALTWSGADWSAPDALADAAARAGLDLDELDRAVTRAPDRFDAILSANASGLTEAGHWGVPSMMFDGEIFFGQDRIPVLLWRMKQKGVSERDTP